MLGRMIRFALPVLIAMFACTLPAQKSLADLQRMFAAEAQQLDAGGGVSDDQRRQLLGRHVDMLQKFVAEQAAGDDRWNGRLMLADLLLAQGDRERAGATLRTIDAAQAPALLLVTAASMAQHLGLKPLRDEWVRAAIAKDGPVPERLAMARLLVHVLQETEQGEAVFTKALADATDDEQRALVRWHRADMMRGREDLPENAPFDELDKLAKELPNTYWGGIARDQLRATTLAPGDPAIDFRAKTSAGDFALAEQKGKAVVLAFWSLGDRDTPATVTLLKDLQRRHADQLVVLAINLDRDAGAAERGARELGLDFPRVADGKGAETDAALRWFIGGPALIVIDHAGKVVRMGLHAGTADGRAEVEEAIAAAVKR